MGPVGGQDPSTQGGGAGLGNAGMPGGGLGNGGATGNGGAGTGQGGGAVGQGGGSVGQGGAIVGQGGAIVGQGGGVIGQGGAVVGQGGGVIAQGGLVIGQGGTVGNGGNIIILGGGPTGNGGSPPGDGGSPGEGGGPSEWTVRPNGYVLTGLWGGYGFTRADTGTVDPTDFEDVGDAGVLCASGSVDGGSYDYTAGVGFNLSQATSGGTVKTIEPTGSGVTVAFSNAGATVLRVQLEGASKRWCYDISSASGSANIAYSDFVTECWEGAENPVAYAKEAIKSLQLVIPGSGPEGDDVPFDVCLNSVTEN